MPRFTATRATWIAILAAALVARLAAGAWWEWRLAGGQPFFFGDSNGYWELARTIADGGPYQYLSAEARVFRAPGYPLLLAPLFLLFPDGPPVMAARALSAVFGTLAVAAAGWWATQLFDARAGRIAGWITALYPGGVALGSLVLSEAPFCPLMLAHLALWGMAWRAASWPRTAAWAAGAGAIAAAATLVRPSWLLFAPFAILVGLAAMRNRRRQLAVGAVLCATLAVGMMPWWIRNARVTGRFVPTTLQVGASLYDGLNPEATGASDMSFVPAMAAREHAEGARAGGDTFEVRLDRRMFAESLAWAREHPQRVLQLAAIKFARVWNVWPNEPAFRGWIVRLAVLATYVPLLVLGVIGAWRFTPRGFPYLLAWLPAIYLTMLHMIFVSSIRYREAPMLALCVLAAGVLARSKQAEREE